MLRTLSLALMVTVLLAGGCSKETEKAKSPESPTPPAEENTFQLELPTGATNITRGGDKLMTIGVERGKNLTGEITLSFDAPEGVSIEPETPKIAADKSDVEFTVKVAADAALGEKSIPVKGEAEGKKTSGSFMIEVVQTGE